MVKMFTSILQTVFYHKPIDDRWRIFLRFSNKLSGCVVVYWFCGLNWHWYHARYVLSDKEFAYFGNQSGFVR